VDVCEKGRITMRYTILALALSILIMLPFSSSSGGIRPINTTASIDTHISQQDSISRDEELAEIITKAVSRKQELKRNLRSLIYKTYTKSVSRHARFNSDITMIYEYHAIHRDTQKISRIKHCGFRCAGTTGLLWNPGLLAVFLKDSIETGKSHVITPLGENTFDYYQYRLLGTVTMSGHKVYEMLVTPIKKDVPLIDGTLFISYNDYSIAGYEFTFNKATKLPGAVDKITFKQDFVLYYGKYWLPLCQQAIGYYFSDEPFSDPSINPMKYFSISEHNITVYDYKINIDASHKTYLKDYTELQENAKNRYSEYWIPIAGALTRMEEHAFITLWTQFRNLRELESMLK